MYYWYMIALLAFGNKDIMANDMKVHLFRVRTMDGAEPLVDLLTRIKADALDARLRRIGYHEMRMESIVAPGEAGNDSPYWLLDFTKLRFEHGPGKISRGAPIEGFELEDDEGFGEETAVLYDPASNYLILQYNHNGPRSGTIEQYLCSYEDAVVGKYSFLIVLDETANLRLAQKDIIKKVQFKVAAPRITNAQLNGNVPLGRVLDMANNLDGETVEIIISSGRGRLSAGVQNLLETLRGMMPAAAHDADGALQTFRVTGTAGDGETDEINMLVTKEEQSIDNLVMGDDLRYTQASRWNGLLRARRGWNNKIQP